MRASGHIRRELRFLTTGEMLSMTKKAKTKLWALRRGPEPETSAMIVWPDTDRARRVRMERLTMQRGDRFRDLGGRGAGGPS